MECCLLSCMGYYLGVLFLMFLGVVMCDELNDRFKRIPFGPVRIPIFGNVLQILWYDRKYTYKALTKLANYHGHTMKFWFGTVGSVVISGLDRINHVLRSDDWLGENDPTWALDRTSKPKGQRSKTTVSENASSIRTWASAKLYANQTLKDYGFGKDTNLDTFLSRKSTDLCGLLQYWKDANEKRIEMTAGFFLPFALSVNWTLVTGQVSSVEDNPHLQSLLKLVKLWEAATIQTSKYLDSWPGLSDLCPERIGYDKLQQINEQVGTLLKNIIQEWRANGQYKKGPKSLIDKFLVKIDEDSENENGGGMGKRGMENEQVNFTDSTLISVLFNIFFPSSLVLESSLNFALMQLARLPEVQGRLREEVGKRGSLVLSVDDFPKMPYLNAFILEVYRTANVIPFERRRMLKTVREGDTRVIHGMTLVLNYDSVNFDKQLWGENVEEFDMDRFLEGGNKVVNENKVLAVVAAKRLCIGELVTKPVIMHAICSILQKFKFQLENEDKSTKQPKPEWGIINKPASYIVTVN